MTAEVAVMNRLAVALAGKRGGLLGAVGRSGCRAGLANEVW